MSYKGAYLTLADAEKGDKAIAFVPSSDGLVYRISNEEFGKITTPAQKASLLDDVKPGFVPKLPKIPSIIFSQVVTFFRHYCRDGVCYEALVQILWDRIDQCFMVSVPKQTATRYDLDAHIDFDDERYLLYMDIHSHNCMCASFSKKDDKDEKASMLYAVIGRLHQDTPEIKVRVSNGGYFLYINPEDVIDISWENTSYPMDWESNIRVKEIKPKSIKLSPSFKGNFSWLWGHEKNYMSLMNGEYADIIEVGKKSNEHSDRMISPRGTRFIDYLKTAQNIDCELIIGNVDMPATFVWDNTERSGVVITEAGYQKFKPIMDAPYALLDNGNIEIFCDNYALGEIFVYAAAGYIGINTYNLYFEGDWCKTAFN